MASVAMRSWFARISSALILVRRSTSALTSSADIDLEIRLIPPPIAEPARAPSTAERATPCIMGFFSA